MSDPRAGIRWRAHMRANRSRLAERQHALDHRAGKSVVVAQRRFENVDRQRRSMRYDSSSAIQSVIERCVGVQPSPAAALPRTRLLEPSE